MKPLLHVYPVCVPPSLFNRGACPTPGHALSLPLQAENEALQELLLQMAADKAAAQQRVAELQALIRTPKEGEFLGRSGRFMPALCLGHPHACMLRRVSLWAPSGSAHCY